MANFSIGRGSKVLIALLPLGSSLEPVSASGTVDALVAKGMTSIPLSAALPANTFIPAGTSLGFTSPTGKEVVARLTNNAIAGATSLSVLATPEEIADDSTFSYPLILKNRTEAGIERSADRESSSTFESEAWAEGLATGLSASISLPGNWSQLDPSYLTAEYAFNNLREIFVWIELPKPSDAYSKGKVYKGRASITGLPVTIPAAGIITGDIELEANGPFLPVEAVPV